MKATIWKYPLHWLPPENVLPMPVAAQILDAQIQDGLICLWALVNPDPGVVQEDREFTIYGTGMSLPNNPGRHIATVQTGRFVFHVFDETRGDLPV